MVSTSWDILCWDKVLEPQTHTEIWSIHDNDGLIALPLDAQNLTQQSNLQLLQIEKLTESGQDDTQTGCGWF